MMYTLTVHFTNNIHIIIMLKCYVNNTIFEQFFNKDIVYINEQKEKWDIALLISIWPCLIYGEMSAALPCAGGTYNYAKRGLNRVWANLAGWHYIVSVVAIGAGETLAFANYFKILMEQLGISIVKLDSRIIAIILVAVFLILNFRGIEQSGKAQTAFMFFFWGCSVCWFLYMIPKVHLEYFGGIAMNSLPPFNEMMYIFGLVWWCYTGFETCVSMGAETKYPQYSLLMIHLI